MYLLTTACLVTLPTGGRDAAAEIHKAVLVNYPVCICAAG